ncbi:GLE1-like protein-domain-containing protein [Elsinoe ampelina]|uniref:mRNA export factor GLE1 n=1 Tax=Elsinoe ampelina TaxID=302913 RepID=A0A6A6GB89_9PEZI|nr:GLE1-like protein-domain-containing protein [Elsinoe ampelina]
MIQSYASPDRNATDSPSRQIVQEFHRLLIDHERTVQNQLDEQVAKQAELHLAALAFAASEHERVRRNAEIARERVELEIERERKRREEEEKDRLERERQAKVAREAEERQRERERLEQQRKEAARTEAEEREIREYQTKQQEARRLKIEAAEAAMRKQQEEEALVKQKAKESAAAAAKAREEAQKAASTPAALATTNSAAPTLASVPTQQTTAAATASHPPVGMDSLQQEFEEVHRRYVDIHKRLKEMRQYVIAESKKIPALKTKLGDWRREIVKCMGQLTADKTKNRKPMTQIQTTLQEAVKFNNPSIDISPFLISVPHPAPGQPIPISGVLIYLLNIFAKSIITQFISETSGGAKTADPVGVVAVSIFATPAFQVGTTIPLIDILLAKYHVVCPPLFCISGPQTTVPGRLRLGWWREGNSFIGEQRHLERMAGLATGWAALTLRDFSKSKNKNPLPNHDYWHAIASVASTKTPDVGSTHVTLLKGLIDGAVPRFMGFYGNMAKAMLVESLVVLPERLKRERKDQGGLQAAGNLEVLREVLQRDVRISLV